MAFVNERDARHQRAVELLGEIRAGAYGAPLTSDYVFDEAVTLSWVRTRRSEVVLRVGHLVLPPRPAARFMDLLFVFPEGFKAAWSLLQEHGGEGLSFTDWTTVEMARGRNIDLVASFDGGLDGWVNRIE